MKFVYRLQRKAAQNRDNFIYVFVRVQERRNEESNRNNQTKINKQRDRFERSKIPISNLFLFCIF